MAREPVNTSPLDDSRMEIFGSTEYQFVTTDESLSTKSTSTGDDTGEDPSDPTVWHLINLIGLAIFLVVVIGPVAYVTFCCKRPFRGRDLKCCVFCNKVFTCYWCRRRCGLLVDDVEADADNISINAIYAANAHDPPRYDEALAMPRVEDTIPGTPPPIYKEFFKVKDDLPRWSFSNPSYEHDDTNTFSAYSERPTSSSYGRQISTVSSANDTASTLTDVESVNVTRASHQLRRCDVTSQGSNSTTWNNAAECASDIWDNQAGGGLEYRQSLRLRCRSAGLRRQTSRVSCTSTAFPYSRQSSFIHADLLPSYDEALLLLGQNSGNMSCNNAKWDIPGLTGAVPNGELCEQTSDISAASDTRTDDQSSGIGMTCHLDTEQTDPSSDIALRTQSSGTKPIGSSPITTTGPDAGLHNAITGITSGGLSGHVILSPPGGASTSEPSSDVVILDSNGGSNHSDEDVSTSELPTEGVVSDVSVRIPESPSDGGTTAISTHTRPHRSATSASTSDVPADSKTSTSSVVSTDSKMSSSPKDSRTSTTSRGSAASVLSTDPRPSVVCIDMPGTLTDTRTCDASISLDTRTSIISTG